MKTVAFVTCKEFPELVDDDKLLVSALAKKHIIWRAIPWDTEGVHWEEFSAVIVRSAWDYALKTPAFLAWIDALESKEVNVWNPASTLRSNVDKKYLLELEKKNIPIIPTVVIPKASRYDIQKLFEENAWDDIVFKPTVGQAGRGVFYGSRADAAELQKTLDSRLSANDMLVQPLVESVRTEGEYSFIFLNGEYSHTALKTTRSGELQVTRRTGGVVVEKTEPPEAFLKEAAAIFHAVDEKFLYARIDAVNIAGRLHVMEIELIEPVLYFQFDTAAVERFVSGIEERF